MSVIRLSYFNNNTIFVKFDREENLKWFFLRMIYINIFL